MEFRLLGPLEVVQDGRPLSLGGAKQRSLLAILLLNANEIVPTDRLIDELWGESPPATADKSVQVYVSRLRKKLGSDRLVTRPPGYALQVDASELDLARFEQLVREATRAEPEDAGHRLRAALDLWRGQPLADLTYERFAQAEITRLEELRWAAHERRIDADLAAGGHADLVSELEALVARHPLRERLHCQLMLALYRCGRQAEALEVYRRARSDLAEQLGLEPGEELRRLEQAILQQDSALDMRERSANGTGTAGAARSLIAAPAELDGLERLLPLAEPLAASNPPRELVVASVVARADLSSTTAALAKSRERLLARGVAARTAAFTSPAPGADLVRLASRAGVDLLLMEAEASPLEGDAAVVLDQAPCDVGMLVRAGGSVRPGPVVVPFGAAWHDWAALELGTWVARATDVPLRLIGAASDAGGSDRDASRLLADASLIVQQRAGVMAEPLLAEPGRTGLFALAEQAGVLVVGFSERWREEGLGRIRSELAATPPAPTVLVRRGPRSGGLAPAESATRFGWSLTVDAA